MLVRLLIKNFGIIEEIDWSPAPGLNMITGETGAGKSLVIDAISTLLSCKIDESTIRNGAAETKIEGIFDLSSRADVTEFLNDHGFETEDATLILTLTQKPGGRTIIRLNGSAVPRSLATGVGRRLVDIHDQSQHLSLLDPSSHLDFLDSYSGTWDLRHEFGKMAQLQSNLIRKAAEVSGLEADAARQQDFLRFQYQEIERAALIEDEDSKLEEQRQLLVSAEKLKLLAIEAWDALDGEDAQSPATNRLSQASAALEKLSAIDARLKTQTEVVRDALFGVSEAARDIRTYASRINADPGRLEEVENRVRLIRDLKRKYGGSISEILSFAEQARKQLSEINNLNETKTILEQELINNRKKVELLAAGLSQKRQTGAISLAQAVNAELGELGMGNARFSVLVTEEAHTGTLAMTDCHIVKYGMTGADSVSFFASTNPGEPPQPLEKIASTGELSRFTLAIKTALASADRIPVLVFDEIDIGVGGRSGDVIGQKLSKIALSHQVICVTHLPQIACYGSHHFSIRKIFDGQRAYSVISELSDDELLEELASMLSSRPSQAATDSARELVDNAASFSANVKETF